MDDRLIEVVCKSYDICIWGYGAFGKTFAYLALKCAGARIVCYCDSRYREQEAYNGIPLIREEKLFGYPGKIFVFVAVKDIYAQEEIAKKLERHKIPTMVFDAQTLTELCNKIEQSDDIALREKYKSLMDDELYLKEIFKQRLGYELDLTEPKTFNEKINWLKINDRKPQYQKFVDKASAKEYITELIGAEHVIPSIGLFDSFDEINFENLPNKFVLKCTHDSGSVIICNDKNAIDKDDVRKKISKALSTNMYWIGREWPYKTIIPRVICESLLVDESGTELKDYKVFCFRGVPKYIQVDFNRFIKHERNLYSTEWKYMGFTSFYPTNPKVMIQKPVQLNRMLEIASVLSKDMRHARIDFYLVGERLYVGEITLYHGSGFEKYSPKEWDDKMGELLVL